MANELGNRRFTGEGVGWLDERCLETPMDQPTDSMIARPGFGSVEEMKQFMRRKAGAGFGARMGVSRRAGVVADGARDGQEERSSDRLGGRAMRSMGRSSEI